VLAASNLFTSQGELEIQHFNRIIPDSCHLNKVSVHYQMDIPNVRWRSCGCKCHYEL